MGIRAAPHEDGRLVPLDEVLQLGEVAQGYAWSLCQEHQNESPEELLDTLTGKIATLNLVRPLSRTVMSNIISKWKFPMVWSTNAIEGSSYTLGETIYAVVKGITAANKPGEDFVNSVDGSNSIEYVRKLLQETQTWPIMTEEQLLELHGILFKRTLSEDLLRGAYRRFAIAVRGSPFVFPSAVEVPLLMKDFFEWLNAPDRLDMHPVSFATEAHLRLVTIHPFEDGNGRTSRLLMNLILMKLGFVPICIATDCAPEYMGFVKKYQMEKMQGLTPDINPLLKLVANEVLGAIDGLLEESQKEKAEKVEHAEKA